MCMSQTNLFYDSGPWNISAPIIPLSLYIKDRQRHLYCLPMDPMHTQYINVSFAESEARSMAGASIEPAIAQFLWAEGRQIIVWG